MRDRDGEELAAIHVIEHVGQDADALGQSQLHRHRLRVAKRGGLLRQRDVIVGAELLEHHVCVGASEAEAVHGCTPGQARCILRPRGGLG